MDERGRALSFLVGNHAVVIPAMLVERVVEVELSPPPPLGRAWIGGLGSSEGTLFVAVDLAIGATPKVSQKGGSVLAAPSVCVLLDTGRRAGLRWALRVTTTLGFVQVTRCGRPASMPVEWPGWVAGALLEDKSVAGLLDVAGMARAYDA